MRTHPLFDATILSALLLSACTPRRASSVTPSSPAVTNAARDAGAHDAAQPPAVARVAFPGRVLHEAAWPLRDRADVRVAVVTDVPNSTPGAAELMWADASGPHSLYVTQFPGAAQVRRMSVVDATGDGEADAVVWIDPATLSNDDVPRSTRVFSFRRQPRPEPHEAPWTSLALGVVADEAALRASVPGLRRFVTPESARSMTDVMLRLGFATPEQFRSIVAPQGVEICDVNAGNARPHGRRCRRTALAAITDAFYNERLRAGVVLFDDPQDPDSSTLLDQDIRCREVGQRVACNVPTGGPSSTTVTFTGPPNARRISNIEFAAYEDS